VISRGVIYGEPMQLAPFTAPTHLNSHGLLFMRRFLSQSIASDFEGSARCAPGGHLWRAEVAPSPGQSPRQFVSHSHCRAPALVSRSNVPAVIRKSPIYAVFRLSTGRWDMDPPDVPSWQSRCAHIRAPAAVSHLTPPNVRAETQRGRNNRR
jgi:hypothetical protein